jgi:tetratricopeptide (TPR) repeat protein
MIITESRSASVHGSAESLLKPTIEDHLLERVSALEALMQRAQDQIEMLLRLIERQAADAIYDRAMLEALLEQLSSSGALDKKRLEASWRDRIAREYKEGEAEEEFERRIEKMINQFRGRDFDLFARLLDAGAELFLEGNIKRGRRYFEKALLLDPSNSELAFFLGEHFFRMNKPALARTYLERAVQSQPDNYPATLMLGIICGDDGDLELAKDYLNRALKIEKNSFAAHYGLGRILVSEGKLRQAISHLKRALSLKPTPEMHYLVGRAYLEEGRTDIAARHLRRCVQMDPNFDAALYHLGLIYLKQDKISLAQEHFRAAYEINPRESRYRAALRARKATRLAPLPVFGRAAATSRRIVTSGDARLTRLLRSDLLGPEPDPRKEQKR